MIIIIELIPGAADRDSPREETSNSRSLTGRGGGRSSSLTEESVVPIIKQKQLIYLKPIEINCIIRIIPIESRLLDVPELDVARRVNDKLDGLDEN